MAVDLVHPPPRMNAVTGLRALAVAAAAEVSGTAASPDHAIAIARPQNAVGSTTS